ncbi:MAG: hypothetical protein GY725_00425 [bacterium]|nr:hypothetical protein [bacterium]
MTFGFFSWDPYGDGSPLQPSREIDIDVDVEDGRSGNPGDSNNAQFVVQPYSTPGNLSP